MGEREWERESERVNCNTIRTFMTRGDEQVRKRVAARDVCVCVCVCVRERERERG